MFDVITIGTATRDVFLHSKGFRIVHDPKHLKRLGFPTGEVQAFALGAKLEVDTPVFTVGGGAANAAVTFARQGFRTAALYKIGRADNHGQAVLKDMKKEGVVSWAAFDAEKMTAYSVVLVAPTGQRTILNYRGASEDMAKSNVPFSKLKARWAYIVPGRIDLGVMLAVIKRLRANGTKIAMNPSAHYLEMGASRLRPLLKHLDLISVNREEAAYLTGLPYAAEKKIFKWLDEWVSGIALMTDGPNGALVSDGKRLYEVSALRARVVDTTGAGDAFGSAFVSALVREKPVSDGCYSEAAMREAIRRALANSTSVVEYIGAQPGILTKRQLSEKRWQHVPVRVHTL
ncbi:MAG TPA: carbohydrate kinase family protein [Candidatus Paceibacterota bacterium]|nr:carbohydrate kinase family protein [Candidatus Paceibacterota bacterium]